MRQLSIRFFLYISIGSSKHSMGVSCRSLRREGVNDNICRTFMCDQHSSQAIVYTMYANLMFVFSHLYKCAYISCNLCICWVYSGMLFHSEIDPASLYSLHTVPSLEVYVSNIIDTSTCMCMYMYMYIHVYTWPSVHNLYMYMSA